MNIENIKKQLSVRPSMATALGIEFLSTPEADTCMATMAVNDNTCQPFGVLNGGASLALAENLAGMGSLALCPDRMCMGISVSGQHVKAALKGDTVTATATIVHRGRRLHTWRVDIKDSRGDLVSTVMVTNIILEETPVVKAAGDTPEEGSTKQ